MKHYRLLTILCLLGMLTLACNLADVISSSLEQRRPQNGEPGAADPDSEEEYSPQNGLPESYTETCLAGTWQIPAMHEYILAAIPSEIVEQYGLEYRSTSGSAYIFLSQDGQARLLADGVELVFEARAAIFSVPVTAQVDGQAVGRYTAENGVLTTTGMDTSGLSASAQAMGQELLSRDQILRTIPLMEPPANKAQYTCEGDKLRLRIAAYPANIPPLELVRVE